MDISYPVTFPYTGTDATTSPYDLFYNPGDPSESMWVLNGWLDADNFASDFQLEDIHTQRGSIVDAYQASGNSNLDFKKSVFGGYDFASADQFRMPTLPGESKFYIPGANRTFYLPVESHVAVFWSVTWNTHAVGTSDVFSKVYFVVDDALLQGDARTMGQTAASTGRVSNFETNRGFAKGRSYHGHYATPTGSAMAAGWHTVGLAVLSEIGVTMTRIHACDITVLTFKA